jgi:putative FmdB family regulatory protein
MPPLRMSAFRGKADTTFCGIAVLKWASGILLEPFDRGLGVPTYQYRCKECGKSFERTETISEHEAAKVRCPKCNSKKVTQVPGRVNVVTSKKS